MAPGAPMGNYGGTPHYEPNSFYQWQAQAEFSEPPLKINGDAQHWSFHNDDSNYFEQPRKLFQLMNGDKKKRCLATPRAAWVMQRSL